MRVMLALLLAAALLAPGCLADGAPQSLEVHGKLFFPEAGVPLQLAQAEVWLHLDSGARRVAFPLPDGSFSFGEVPLGVHTLSVDTYNLVFPTVKLDVGVAKKGSVGAAAIDVPGAPAMPYPLLLRPVAALDYFEKRQGFNLIAWLKTPMGMISAFGVFSMLIMPKLKLEPEEMRELTESLQGAPSGGGSGGSGSGGGRQRLRAD